MIPHRYWIRATYITTGRPWVTTDELERRQRDKLVALWHQGLEPGWLGRAHEILWPPRICRRSAHWIGGRVGDTRPGSGHDGGVTGLPCSRWRR